MGLVDKMKNIMGYPEDDDYDQDEEILAADNDMEEDPVMQTRIKSPSERINSSRQQFVLTKPEKFDDSIQIATYLIERKTVVLNLEAIGKELARRIIDFLSGTAFAVGAKIKRVAISTYIIVPNNADITGEMLDELESGMII